MNLEKNSVAVITGAGSGIGRALSIQLSQMGANLALADMNEDALNVTVELISAKTKISAHIVDVSNRERMQEFANEVKAEHGKATYVINNAGVTLLGTVEESSIEDIEWLMGINFWGTVYGVKFFLPILKEQPKAHIVNISSIFGLIAPTGQSAYCASKFAVRGFTESLRHELEDTNVFVSCVHPGGIKTNIANSARVCEKTPPSEKQFAIKKFDKGTPTTPETAADIIIRGMLAGKPKILIGPDAKVVDSLVRVFPIRYWNVLKKRMGFTPKKKRLELEPQSAE